MFWHKFMYWPHSWWVIPIILIYRIIINWTENIWRAARRCTGSSHKRLREHPPYHRARPGWACYPRCMEKCRADSRLSPRLISSATLRRFSWPSRRRHWNRPGHHQPTLWWKTRIRGKWILWNSWKHFKTQISGVYHLVYFIWHWRYEIYWLTSKQKNKGDERKTRM